jgi:sugar O-acyltransferase (sialic acid O-acetyltransferase NeuD family)
MHNLVIFGVKNFAEIAHYYFTHDSAYSVAGFTVDGDYLRESTFQGLPVVPFEEVDRHFPPQQYSMFVAVGIGGVNGRRAAKVAEAESKGYPLASFISSRADRAPDLKVGPNSMVMERSVIQPFVTIGRDSILWSSTRIGFHGRIGDHCWLVCPILGESVTVGDFSFIGLNATIAPFISIGQRNIIGAGALIMKETNDDEVYRGQASTPSRVPSYRLWKT